MIPAKQRKKKTITPQGLFSVFLSCLFFGSFANVSFPDDVVMGDEEVSPQPAPPPSSAPEKEWAKKANDGSLFAGFAKRSKSGSPAIPQSALTEEPVVPVSVSLPSKLVRPKISLRERTPGGDGVAADLKAHEDRLSNALSVPPANSSTHPSGRRYDATPVWSMASLESIRTSMGFLEEHIASLRWVQECLINHQKALVRARSMNSAMLDSVSRAIYMQNRFQDVKKALELERVGDTVKTEG
ncbi:hypothetical protein NMY22_g14845 [Coprinellus aureogranulatus]|nr:hypothetical protein NMY22_g14845 [Coprinellus aureogranulatus]